MGNKSRREQIEEMLRVDPGDGFLRYGLAMEYLSEGDEEKAEAGFRDLLRAEPDYVPAYLQLGQLFVRLGREEEARTAYREGIAQARKKGDEHAANEMTNFLAMLE